MKGNKDRGLGMSKRTLYVGLSRPEIEAILAVALDGYSWDTVQSITCSDGEARRLNAAFERAMQKLGSALSSQDGRMRRAAVASRKL